MEPENQKEILAARAAVSVPTSHSFQTVWGDSTQRISIWYSQAPTSSCYEWRSKEPFAPDVNPVLPIYLSRNARRRLYILLILSPVSSPTQ
jgi:hypothetical protein